MSAYGDVAGEVVALKHGGIWGVPHAQIALSLADARFVSTLIVVVPLNSQRRTGII